MFWLLSMFTAIVACQPLGELVHPLLVDAL